MKARMEKYDEDGNIKQRTAKNENLYSEVQNMNIDYVDIDVDNALELNPSSPHKKSREDYQKQRELNKILPNTKNIETAQDIAVEPKEDRVYDINEILKMARENKLFEEPDKKRLINTEYNILTKLDINELDNDELKKEDLRSLIDDIYEKEGPKKDEDVKKYPRNEEKLLSDLFDEQEEIKVEENLSKNILDNEEKEEEKEEVEESNEEIKEEETPIDTVEEEKEPEQEVITPQEEKKLENSMYDFGLEKKSKKKEKKHKNMLEGVDLEKELVKEPEEEEEKEGKGLVIAIVIVVILILLTCGFFVYEYFFGA